MRRALLILPALILWAGAASAQRGSERRCGWYERASPADHVLTDRSRQWLLGARGGYQARGIGLIGEPAQSQWVRGRGRAADHACACAQVRTDRRNSQVTLIHTWDFMPPSECRGQRGLREPGHAPRRAGR